MIKTKNKEDYKEIKNAFYLLSGTLVLTNKGYKCIEDINENDYLLTHKNRYKKVSKITSSQSKDLLKVSSVNSNIYTTSENLFYVLEKDDLTPKWVKTKDLTIDMCVGLPIKEFCNTPNKLTIKNDYKISQIHIVSQINKLIENENFWFLLGYIYENYEIIDKKSIYLEINDDELILNKLTSVIDMINNHLDDMAKFKYTIKNENNQFVIKQKIIQDIIYHFLTLNKRYDTLDNIILLPNSLLKSFLDGYSLNRNNIEDITYSKSEKILVNEIIYCLNKVFDKHYKVEYGKELKIKEITSNDIIKNHNYLWFPVESIKNVESDTYNDVYTLEIEEDNSYVAEHIIILNN